MPYFLFSKVSFEAIELITKIYRAYHKNISSLSQKILLLPRLLTHFFLAENCLKFLMQKETTKLNSNNTKNSLSNQSMPFRFLD